MQFYRDIIAVRSGDFGYFLVAFFFQVKQYDRFVQLSQLIDHPVQLPQHFRQFVSSVIQSASRVSATISGTFFSLRMKLMQVLRAIR